MSDPFLTPSLRGSHVVMPEVREQSASVIQIESSRLLPAILFVGLIAAAALAISIVGYIAANEKAALTERETRIMQDDLKYIRSYLSARGIQIPANHEEAEEGIEK
jgi:hypothetical protein